MHAVQKLVTTRAPFIRTPRFLGDFEIVGDKSWGSNQDILFQRKNPHFFRIPQNFGNRIVELFLSHDFILLRLTAVASSTEPVAMSWTMH